MPDDLRAQIEPLLDAIEAMGLPLLRVEGVEADDVIGTLASRRGRGQSTVISTGDKDLAQLVDRARHARQHDGQHEARSAGVQAKFGVTPEQMVDYLALIGDTIDNIPGVAGVGRRRPRNGCAVRRRSTT